MPQIKVAIRLRSLRLPFKQALHTVRGLGARAVEIDARGEIRPAAIGETGLRQIRKLLTDCDLQVAALGFSTRRGYDEPEDLQRRVDATKEAMRFARKLGAPYVVNQVGRVPPETDPESFERFRQVLADLGSWGDRTGAILAAETGIDSGSELKRLIAALPTGALAAALNPGLLVAAGHSPLDAVAALADDIVYVYARDGVRGRPAAGDETILGRGSVDFPALAAALEEHTYRGYWTVGREGVGDPVREITQAISYLHHL
jgi:sugar phosphate isomerase/epimerase